MKKYFIKYTLEFFVIVMGITFSFFVQNIRNDIQIDTKRALIIDNLSSELQSNQAYIDKTELKFKREFEYVNKLLLDSLTIQDVKKYPKNFSPLNPFFSVVKFNPSRSIYNSIVNDGSFNIIEPSGLKVLIDEVYKLHHNSIINLIESEQKIADKADDFFVNNYTEIYVKNFWFNYDEHLVNSVFNIMQKDSKFKALMVQKISFMEVKIAQLDNYSKKRDSLINLIKTFKP
ncbi:hypothetical protein N9E92_06535 [Polaribacter sp.]|mgnify:FL=1|nr:hypothetical protein [Polaribacter sp.]MDC1374931.1 hypothetical protein [Polaribacter sp.]